MARIQAVKIDAHCKEITNISGNWEKSFFISDQAGQGHLCLT